MIYRKYFDEKGYFVGISTGLITSNEQITTDRELDDFIALTAGLENIPQKTGYTAHVIVHEGPEVDDYFQFEYVYEPIPKEELSDSEIKEMLKEEILNGVQIDTKPASKEGYTLVPSFNGTKVVWEFVKNSEDDDIIGTYICPIAFVTGMMVEKDKFYTDGENIWEAIKTGVPTNFEDREYFDIIG